MCSYTNMWAIKQLYVIKTTIVLLITIHDECSATHVAFASGLLVCLPVFREFYSCSGQLLQQILPLRIGNPSFDHLSD
jgi:hypothetical protein